MTDQEGIGVVLSDQQVLYTPNAIIASQPIEVRVTASAHLLCTVLRRVLLPPFLIQTPIPSTLRSTMMQTNPTNLPFPSRSPFAYTDAQQSQVTSAQPSSDTSTPAADRDDRTASPTTAAQYDAPRSSLDNKTGESFSPTAPSNDNADPSTTAAEATLSSSSTAPFDNFSESGVGVEQARRSFFPV